MKLNVPHLPVIQNVILDENYDAIEQSVFYSNQIRGRTKVFNDWAKMKMRLAFAMPSSMVLCYMLHFFWYCFCVVINHAWINQMIWKYMCLRWLCVLHHLVFRIENAINYLGFIKPFPFECWMSNDGSFHLKLETMCHTWHAQLSYGN